MADVVSHRKAVSHRAQACLAAQKLQSSSSVMLQTSSIGTEAVYTSHRTVTAKPQTCFLCKRKAMTQSRRICSNVSRPDAGGAVQPKKSIQDNKKPKLNKDQQQSRQNGTLTGCVRSQPAIFFSQQVTSAQVCLRQNELCSSLQLAPSEVA